MERAPGCWASTRRQAKVLHRGVDVPCRKRRARRVLAEHIDEDAKFECLPGKLVRPLEASPLVVRKVQLPKQHRLRRLVERRARR